ncbi:ABC transporter permease subunit [Gilvibacter sp.]|uniref:ABC transporter permease subunit n=1 Tax=Gilvibacter sp. TaxID=2729997 RepID=UPI0035BE4E32
MIAIIKREIASFFSSAVGYLVIGVFLVVNGLFLWVFDGPFNILYAGFADLASFFQLAPWILVFLIPAVSMRSFSEEKRSGTLELLLTKPISTSGLVLAKYLGILVLLIISLLPTYPQQSFARLKSMLHTAFYRLYIHVFIRFSYAQCACIREYSF